SQNKMQRFYRSIQLSVFLWKTPRLNILSYFLRYFPPKRFHKMFAGLFAAIALYHLMLLFLFVAFPFTLSFLLNEHSIAANYKFTQTSQPFCCRLQVDFSSNSLINADFTHVNVWSFASANEMLYLRDALQ